MAIKIFMDPWGKSLLVACEPLANLCREREAGAAKLSEPGRVAAVLTDLCILGCQFLQLFYQQQEEIFLLREQLRQKDVQIRQLELEMKNTRNFLGSH